MGTAASNGPGQVGVVLSDNQRLAFLAAMASLGRCLVEAGALLARGAITQPKNHIGDVLHFADGSAGRVYRETEVRGARSDAPVILVVAFRLRWIRGWAHAVFRAESVLNTPPFVGFPGFVSKLWVAHDATGRYRGVYQWNDGRLADRYARALWWVLALVSVRNSIQYVVVPGIQRDEELADPDWLRSVNLQDQGGWWRLTRVERPARPPSCRGSEPAGTFDSASDR
jgi:hypothetical protein